MIKITTFLGQILVLELRAVYEQVRYLLFDEPTSSASLSAAVFIKAHGF